MISEPPLTPSLSPSQVSADSSSPYPRVSGPSQPQPLPVPSPQAPPSHADYQHASAAAAAATASAALSQQQSPVDAQPHGRKRKSGSVPGSRGVANLTPEQLAKKRANDREAQRAIRERTRHTIDSLEQRIKELESQQPYQDFQRVVQERDRALAECEELRRRLGAVAGIVGAQHPSLNDLAALTAQQSHLPPLSSLDHASEYPPRRSSHDVHQQHIHPDLRSISLAEHQPPAARSLTTPAPEATARAEGDLSIRSRSPGPPANYRHLSISGLVTKNNSPLARKLLYQESDQGQSSVAASTYSQHELRRRRALPGLPALTSPPTSPAPPHISPFYDRFTLVGDATCPLDFLLNDFHKSRRKMREEGAFLLEMMGPEDPYFDALLDPTKLEDPACHAASALLVGIISKFPSLTPLAEMTGILYVMFLNMRWQVCPCIECFNRLPDWYKPVEEQHTRYHSAYVDFIPWPFVRRQYCLRVEPVIPFDDWFVPYTYKLRLNWPHSDHDIFVQTPEAPVSRKGPTPSASPPSAGNTASKSGQSASPAPASSASPTFSTTPGRFKLSPEFERHVRDLRNWSLGESFKRAFPHYVDESVRITLDDKT